VPVVNLARQLLDVFKTYAQGTDLKIVLVAGQQSAEQECEQLYEILPNLQYGKPLPMATADIVS